MRSVLHENSEYLPVRPLLEAIRPEFLSPEVGVLMQELGEGPLLAQILCRQLVSIPVVEENDSLIFDEWRAAGKAPNLAALSCCTRPDAAVVPLPPAAGWKSVPDIRRVYTTRVQQDPRRSA